MGIREQVLVGIHSSHVLHSHRRDWNGMVSCLPIPLVRKNAVRLPQLWVGAIVFPHLYLPFLPLRSLLFSYFRICISPRPPCCGATQTACPHLNPSHYVLEKSKARVLVLLYHGESSVPLVMSKVCDAQFKLILLPSPSGSLPWASHSLLSSWICEAFLSQDSMV